MRARKVRQIPDVGTSFQKVYKGKAYRLTVVETSKGVAFKLGRDTFNSPSGAAKSLTGTEVNGWAFWGIDKG